MLKLVVVLEGVFNLEMRIVFSRMKYNLIKYKGFIIKYVSVSFTFRSFSIVSHQATLAAILTPFLQPPPTTHWRAPLYCLSYKNMFLFSLSSIWLYQSDRIILELLIVGLQKSKIIKLF